jgi:hypothetical protein
VTIGYGLEGGMPIEFIPNEVTFFKVFVTSKYVDLKGIEQCPALGSQSGRIPNRVPPPVVNDFWESWVFVVRS